ncbi:MAG: ZIP family metal transporter [Oceanicaulis sp.]
MSPIAATIVFGVLAALVAGLALTLVRTASGFTRANAPILAAFAGGIVITMALVKLLPEALVLSESAPWLVLAGFAGGFVLHGLASVAGHSHNQHAGSHSHHDHGPNQHHDHADDLARRASLAPVFAIALHSALDGLVYAVSFEVDPIIGLSAASGLVLHEFPEALICFVLLQRAGLSDRNAAIVAFLASGVTTLVSAAIAAPYASGLDPATLGALFAVVAGLLLHTGAAHLLHEAESAGAVKGGAAVFAGAGLAAAMTFVHAPHVHELDVLEPHLHELDADGPEIAAPAGDLHDHHP